MWLGQQAPCPGVLSLLAQEHVRTDPVTIAHRLLDEQGVVGIWLEWEKMSL